MTKGGNKTKTKPDYKSYNVKFYARGVFKIKLAEGALREML